MRRSFGSATRGAAFILTFCTFLLISGDALGVGGTCPSGANYLSTTTNSLVALSSLGVKSCYFIAANGSDTNNGTSESTPWLHAPGMPNCSGNCATVLSATPSGTGYIFRGGDTWHFGNSNASPYTGGTWNLNGPTWYHGTSGAPIYFGVDKSWYSGSSWARPILTGDNPTSTSQSLSSCSYQISPNNGMVDIIYEEFVIFDNFELTGLCESDLGGTANDHYFDYGSSQGPITLTNNYIHGWTHVAFANPQNPIGSCTSSTVCLNLAAFYGSVISGGPPDDTIMYDVVDGSDSDPVAMQFCYCGFWNVAYSYFSGGSQLITRDQHLFHDSTITNFVDNGHANVMESVGDTPGPSNAYAIYNNVFDTIYVSPYLNSNVVFWPYPPVGSTLYWFNNVVYNVGPGEFFNMGQNNSDEGNFAIFNNTFQVNHRTDGGWDGISCSATGNADPFTNANNLYITSDSSSFYSSNCSGKGTDTTSLLMTNATATSGGYASSGTYAYSPTSSSSRTVGVGTNEVKSFCSALSTAASTDSTLSDAATGCLSDTRYACAYNSANHTVTCPGRTAVARPSSGNWDIGAYQFSNPTVQPPTNVQATAH